MLPEIVNEMCDSFQIRNPEKYAIKWDDEGVYLTEKVGLAILCCPLIWDLGHRQPLCPLTTVLQNRSELRAGAVLCVTLSPVGPCLSLAVGTTVLNMSNSNPSLLTLEGFVAHAAGRKGHAVHPSTAEPWALIKRPYLRPARDEEGREGVCGGVRVCVWLVCDWWMRAWACLLPRQECDTLVNT
jgi:hypothetical protein